MDFFTGFLNGLGENLVGKILGKLNPEGQQQPNTFNTPEVQQESNKYIQEFTKSLPQYQMRAAPLGDNPSSLDKIMHAIGSVESSNRYNIKGVPTKYGRPLGRFQILESNLPSWSKEALGRSVSKDEFLNSPELQDKIARHKMQQYYDKYGTAQDVASLWYSGKPYHKAKNVVDPYLNQSVAQYVNKVGGYL